MTASMHASSSVASGDSASGCTSICRYSSDRCWLEPMLLASPTSSPCLRTITPQGSSAPVSSWTSRSGRPSRWMTRREPSMAGLPLATTTLGLLHTTNSGLSAAAAALAAPAPPPACASLVLTLQVRREGRPAAATVSLVSSITVHALSPLGRQKFARKGQMMGHAGMSKLKVALEQRLILVEGMTKDPPHCESLGAGDGGGACGGGCAEAGSDCADLDAL
mmetsp:Transcript_83513/g.258227  ORF Transcript_83513/g.258227 Transcript_83513/m.258227 type:complete len:221 (-) Transcript_83513:573-1235(-)